MAKYRQLGKKSVHRVSQGSGDSLSREQQCRKILARTPNDLNALSELALALAQQGRIQEASDAYTAALDRYPNAAHLHSNYANLLNECQRCEAAYHHARRATELASHDPRIWINFSHVCVMLRRSREGEEAARQVLVLTDNRELRRQAWNNLGNALREQGQLKEAIAAYRQAGEGEPLTLPFNNILLTLQSDESATSDEIMEVAREFAEQFESPYIPDWPTFADRDATPLRRLRVGLLSPDFNDHSVMYFAESLFNHLDRQQFELIALYLNAGDGPVTQRVRRKSDRFVELNRKSIEEQVRIIKDLEIDVLIDLAGHTAKNGLPTMARKPAPVQMTWLGYPGTTGLAAIDWRITDEVADLPDSDDQYTEKLIRLSPPFCVYRPCSRNPLNRYMPAYQVQATPALKNGFITFGSCNSLAKLTPRVLAVWGNILQQVPTARLLIEGKGLDNEQQATEFRKRCDEAGLPLERLDLLPMDSSSQYLTYHRIDIALDPFPLTGGTTSFDLLWMGLPLVTMEGDSFRSRMGVSLLTAIDRTEWIARDEADYIRLAVQLSADIPALNAGRLQQRAYIEGGPLMDERRFARLFGDAIRHGWLAWCADRSGTLQQTVMWQPTQSDTAPFAPPVFIAPQQQISFAEAQRRLTDAVQTARKRGAVVASLEDWRPAWELAALILEAYPYDVEALAVLAEIEEQHGNPDVAACYLRHAAAVAPDHLQIQQRLEHLTSFATLRQQAVERYLAGDSTLLQQVCDDLLQKDPQDIFALVGTSQIKAGQGDFAGAIETSQEALRYHPDDGQLHQNLGDYLYHAGRIEEAYGFACRATELLPESTQAWINLSGVAHATSHLQKGMDAARRALELATTPDETYQALNNLGNCLREQGRTQEATEAYRRAQQASPIEKNPFTNLLLAMQSDESVPLDEIVTVAREYAAIFEAPLRTGWPDFAGREATPWRKLRVAFLSPDFCGHPVMYFVEGLLAQMDRRLFEVLALSVHAVHDTVTKRVHRHVDRFVSLVGLAPEKQAALIQELQVDILIDLAGHTNKNGLPTMLHKPAPVQMTWLGYPGTTGLTAIDWRITDVVADPPGSEAYYTEKLARMPAPFCVYRPCLRQPLQRYQPAYQVQPTPAVANGCITFGSCNSLAKLTDRVLQTWARILEQVPSARLLIEGQGLDNPYIAGGFADRCKQAGLPPDRLELLARHSKNQYLTYHRIDIALDPFPLTGGTTTFDLLWMGVPLVTMEGDSFRSRMGVAILTAADLQQWVARTEEDYINIAVKLAADIPTLNNRRLQQRRRLETSPIMDELRFVRLFEEVLRQAWLRWCAKRVVGEDKTAIERQLAEWAAARPALVPPEPRISLATGEGVPMSEARSRLHGLLTTAMTVPTGLSGAGELQPAWRTTFELVAQILESVPNEPVAISALGEIEYAHGNIGMAITYMRHAATLVPDNAYFQQRLAHWLQACNHG